MKSYGYVNSVRVCLHNLIFNFIPNQYKFKNRKSEWIIDKSYAFQLFFLFLFIFSLLFLFLKINRIWLFEKVYFFYIWKMRELNTIFSILLVFIYFCQVVILILVVYLRMYGHFINKKKSIVCLYSKDISKRIRKNVINWGWQILWNNNVWSKY